MGWPITAQHSSITRSLAVITRSTCRMLVVVDLVLYLHSARISQRHRSTQLLVKQCQDFRLLQYSRVTEKQTSAIREFVSGRDMLVVCEADQRYQSIRDWERRLGRFANGQWQVAQHQPPCGVFSHLHAGPPSLTGAGRLQLC